MNIKTEKKIRIACVGDSITFGQGLENRAKNSYPRILSEMLGEGFYVKNFGVPNASVLKNAVLPYWEQIAYKRALKFSPDIVVIKLGTNDANFDNWHLKAEFVVDYIEMVQNFQNLPSKPEIFLCYPAPSYGLNWNIDNKNIIEGVIPLIAKVAEQTNSHIIDIYSALGDKEELFPDKLHPNKAGAMILAESVYKCLKGTSKIL